MITLKYLFLIVLNLIILTGVYYFGYQVICNTNEVTTGFLTGVCVSSVTMLNLDNIHKHYTNLKTYNNLKWL